MKKFTIAGPVKLDKHYALDPLQRIDLSQLLELIDDESYFVLHAPRQTGKTSMLRALMDHLNGQSRYYCLYINVEGGQSAREDVGAVVGSILNVIAETALINLKDSFLHDHQADLEKSTKPHVLLYLALTRWCLSLDKPLVLLIDEIDALIGDSLISVLRQLRMGYPERPNAFPQSVILCGVRDVRDYRIHGSSEREPVAGGSAFNVKAASLRLGNFSREETEALLQQHTDATGQVFEPDAKSAVYDDTMGQPWLVNALANEVTNNMRVNRDRSVAITGTMIGLARENLIQRRETHLDQLADKLQEPRVHRVIAPILAGAAQSTQMRQDDIEYAYDLGLIELHPQIGIANPIYREVIPWVLTWPIQLSLSQKLTWYTDAETGRLQMDKLLVAFQDFFRRHSEHWTQVYQYKEAGAQLLLQAFLQRVVNGGGRIECEYGLGAGRTDLYLAWPHSGGTQDIVLELKLRHGARESTINAALPQITAYMDRCNADEGHLLLFDQSRASWEEKIFQDQVVHQNHRVQVWGM